ncbi:hypothetical protein WMF27_09125 [Sorangium sp. So ce281]|uniref:hypothetical protein n=1 Tax=unclassified Sorangium TaxID=2621164 RepID=UPI003F5F22E2
MSDLDDLFQNQENADLSHVARTWLRRIRGGEKAEIEVIRKRSGLSYGPAKLHVIFNGTDERRDDWDTHLSDVLASEGVRAVDEDNEALRIALMLEDWFQYPARRFGDDYFNSVLVEYLKGGELGAIPEVQRVLRHVHEHSPYKGGSYDDCRNEVVAVLQRAAQALTHVGYRREQAKRILIDAVVKFLDDRFGITNRQMLGLL